MSVTTDKEMIRQIFIRLPVNERFSILQDLLQTLSPPHNIQYEQRKTFSKALGLLAPDVLPPTDEEVKQILRKHRLEKYG